MKITDQVVENHGLKLEEFSNIKNENYRSSCRKARLKTRRVYKHKKTS